MSDTEREGVRQRLTPPYQEEATEPRKVNRTRLSLSWPFIHFETDHETRRDHFLMFLLGIAAAGVTIAVPQVATGFAVIPAFLAGFALNNFLSYDLLYEIEEVDDVE